MYLSIWDRIGLYLGWKRDWKIVVSKEVETEEWYTYSGDLDPTVKLFKQTVCVHYVLERCSLTGKERGLIVRPKNSYHREITFIDPTIVKLKTGYHESASQKPGE